MTPEETAALRKSLPHRTNMEVRSRWRVSKHPSKYGLLHELVLGAYSASIFEPSDKDEASVIEMLRGPFLMLFEHDFSRCLELDDCQLVVEIMISNALLRVEAVDRYLDRIDYGI